MYLDVTLTAGQASDKFKLLRIDTKGEFLCDFTLASADSQAIAMKYMQGGDKSAMHPVTQMILATDETADEPDYEEILSRRCGITTAEFLGFTPEHVFMQRPELMGFDVIEVEGAVQEVPRFNPGSWYMYDNPEFMNN